MLPARLAFLAVSLAPLVASLPSDAAAQHPQDRAGLTVAFGIGGGTRGLDCDGCELGREGGAAAHLFVGATPTARLTVGGEVSGWGKAEDGVEQSVASFMAVAHFYPVVARGLFVTGGAGITQMTLGAPGERLTTEGPALQVGAGYDLRVASGFSLTPYVQWVRGVRCDAELEGVDIGEANPDYLQLGVGFTWH